MDDRRPDRRSSQRRFAKGLIVTIDVASFAAKNGGGAKLEGLTVIMKTSDNNRRMVWLLIQEFPLQQKEL
jgi:hypothetical protein